MVHYRKYRQGRCHCILPELGAQQGREHQRAKEMSDYTASVKSSVHLLNLRTRKIGELGEQEVEQNLRSSTRKAAKPFLRRQHGVDQEASRDPMSVETGVERPRR